MKFTYNWLKDYINLKVPADKLAQLLTMSGLEVKSVFKSVDDSIFDCEVTPNRPDLLSLIGIAREIQALTGEKLRIGQTKIKQASKNNNSFSVCIKDKTACARYIAVIVKNVNVCDSPKWLRKRIESIGLRSVNNIVDVTNYCLWEMGQPIHAFDLDKLQQKITVRFAKQNEKIITIDGKELKLDEQILLICDSAQPVAIAGIMGGKNTEVTSQTKNILLEFACFDPKAIRMSTRKLGLSSDSSYRFERGVDLENLSFVAKRTAELIKAISKNCSVSQVIDLGKKKKNKKSIVLSVERLNKVLGSDLTKSKVLTILKSLGLGIKQSKASILVSVPSFRPDLTIEEDLVEEVARIYGYDNIKTTKPYIQFNSLKENPLEDIKRLAKQNLLKQGLFEIITYSLLNNKIVEQLGFAKERNLELLNPLSQEASILRPSLLPGLLLAVKNNISHQNKDLKFFEIGNVFQKKDETARLAVALTGDDCTVVNSRVNVNVKMGIFHLKGVLENIFSCFGIREVDFIAGDERIFEKNESFILKSKGLQFASMGKLAQDMLDALEIKLQDVFAAEVDLEAVMSLAKLQIKFKPYSLYPLVVRDISLLIDEKVSFKQIVSVITDLNIESNIEVRLIDYYKGKHIPDGAKGLTISINYRSSQHTLTDDEINSMHNSIKEALKTELKVSFR
ncbi:MAG: phenylalanine--tRNA ligase subunit beta [Candidatus Gygaella obscura]|nr:phenylalanine--tRNA ligase subunit beta [Candidatus Gygaella obscura]